MRIRSWSYRITACATLFLLAACDGLSTPTGIPSQLEPAFSNGGIYGSANGGGVFDAGVPVHFHFGVVQTGSDGEANGNFGFRTELGGLAIDFKGRATCLAVDAVNNRAWIGGVVTQNKSEDPRFTMAIHQVGRDIWFRVVDYGEGSNATQADRTTFVGFEGSAGIITSAEYCATMPWPGPPTDVVDARTGPLLSGNIQVKAF